MNHNPLFRNGAVLPLLLAALCCLPKEAAAQQPSLNSHEVNADGSVTFRLYAPTATKVAIGLDYDHREIAMTKGADGVWTYTSGPLQPALHTYELDVDGTHIVDPLNPSVDDTYNFLSNLVTVPGPPQLWDAWDVPHGVVHHHIYKSAFIQNLPDGIEDYYVYTPPGYDGSAGKSYPVLYLLHGWSGKAQAWLDQGKFNLILDNLIAKGRVLPMIVVTPLAYGDLKFVTGGFDFSAPKEENNLKRFGDALLKEIVPQVESAYRAGARRSDRAIAGLSMGGAESLFIGLNHPELFGWVGGFSSGVIYNDFDRYLPNLDPKNAPSLLWIACGTEDSLLAKNREFEAWLKAKGLAPTVVETPGIHNWPVWRDDLIRFAPLLFRKGGSGP